MEMARDRSWRISLRLAPHTKIIANDEAQRHPVLAVYNGYNVAVTYSALC
jgi:hypothetical protein